MAKQRRQFNITDAIESVCAAIEIESIPNPTREQKEVVHQAKVEAANVVRNSGFMTLGEHGDDEIETRHQVDEILEAGGIDPVAARRNPAVAGAMAMVEAKRAAEQQPENPDDDEENPDEVPDF